MTQANQLSTYVFFTVLLLSLLFVSKQSHAGTYSYISASDTNISISGRVDKTDMNNVVFAFPGVSIKALFEGTSIDVILQEYGSGSSTTTNYLNVIIDDGAPMVLKLSSSQSVYKLASGLTSGVHSVELIKRTESNVGKVGFKGFRLDAGKNLVAPAPAPTRKIEFIGNSITCGYGNEVSTNNPNNYHFTSANENNYMAWGAVTARNVNAQYSCVAYSGRGLFQNNTGSKTGVLPELYERTFADEANSRWNHYDYIPDVLVINLGTNDFAAEIVSSAYHVDSALYVDAYIGFINTLRSYYPNSSIICCVGTMMSDSYPSGGKHWTRIQKYTSAVRDYYNAQGDAKVYYLKLDPQTAPYGEDWHPTLATHTSMANTLTDFINTTIVWDNCLAHVSLGNDINLKYMETPVILDSKSTANTNVVYSWYKDDVLLSGSGASFQIADTSGAPGTYRVVRDSAGCKYEDDIVVKNEQEAVGTICKWEDNKNAAVVLTFDDWSPGHPAIAVPELRKRNMNGTFFIVSDFVSDWNPIASAALDGNEIGNHTKTHPNLTSLFPAQLAGEIEYPDSVINANIPTQTVTTFDYPFGSNNQLVIDYLRGMNYIGARGVQPASQNYSYNFASSIADYYKVLTFALSTTTSIGSYGQQLQNIIAGGGMLTVLYHSINSKTVTDNNYAAVPESSFQYQLDTIQSLRNKIWVTKFSNALTYHREASCAQLVQISNRTANEWVLNLSDTLSDSEQFNYPLSIILRMNGADFDMVKQNGEILPVKIFNDTIMFRAIPGKGFINLLHSGIDMRASLSEQELTNSGQNTIRVSAQVQSTSGIQEVYANLSELGGDAHTTLSLTGTDTYTVEFNIAAGFPLGYKTVMVYARDSLNNQHVEHCGITISSGIAYGTVHMHQTPDSLYFSLYASDDTGIALVIADLSPVNGSATSVLQFANDSAYISVSAQEVSSGNKTILFTISDDTGNILRVSKTFLISALISSIDNGDKYQSGPLYPSPASSTIFLDRISSPITDIAVFDQRGKACLMLKGNALRLDEMDISGLRNGVYTFSISTDTGTVNQIVIIQK